MRLSPWLVVAALGGLWLLGRRGRPGRSRAERDAAEGLAALGRGASVVLGDVREGGRALFSEARSVTNAGRPELGANATEPPAPTGYAYFAGE